MSSSEFRAGMSREQRASSSLRARLLRQARLELLRHGVDGVGTDQLTAAAGLARGAFYRCFASWESLLDALVAEAVGANGAAVERALGAPEDPAVTVAELVRQTVRTTERDPLLARLAEAGRGVAEAVTDDFSRRVLRSLSRGVWVGRFPVASALVHLCAIRGAVLEVLRGRLDGLLPPAAADELAAAVLQMLGLPAGEAVAVAAAPLAEVEPPLALAYAAQGRGTPRPKLIPL
jgi:AcrR family transcriptional regulator